MDPLTLASTQPTAVIAPMAPAAFQVLAPIFLGVAATVLVAIPRWFLWFSYFLWRRIAPPALQSRTVPGVRSRVFQGVALRGFVDDYSFSVPDRADIAACISDFFRARGAKEGERRQALAFFRGRPGAAVLSHIIPWRERDFGQTITVTTDPGRDGQVDVRVRYTVDVLCMLRIQPAGLQDEAGELYRELLTAA